MGAPLQSGLGPCPARAPRQMRIPLPPLSRVDPGAPLLPTASGTRQGRFVTLRTLRQRAGTRRSPPGHPGDPTAGGSPGILRVPSAGGTLPTAALAILGQLGSAGTVLDRGNCLAELSRLKYTIKKDYFKAGFVPGSGSDPLEVRVAVPAGLGGTGVAVTGVGQGPPSWRDTPQDTGPPPGGRFAAGPGQRERREGQSHRIPVPAWNPRFLRGHGITAWFGKEP